MCFVHACVPDLGKTLKTDSLLLSRLFWSRAREEIRKRTNLSQWQDKMIIAVVSRLTPQKGVHLIKHAAYKVGLFDSELQCLRKVLYTMLVLRPVAVRTKQLQLASAIVA